MSRSHPSPRLSHLPLFAGALVILPAMLSAGCKMFTDASGPSDSANASPGGAGPAATPDPAHTLFKNGDFANGKILPWMTSFTAPANGDAEVKDGAMCITINEAGKDPWDAQIRHREMVLQKDHNYAVKFRAWASRSTKADVKLAMSGPPYTGHFSRSIELTTEPQTFEYKFTNFNADDPGVEFTFHLGGVRFRGEGPLEACFDDLILADPTFTPVPPEPAPVVPKVRHNQVGYAPHFAKVATVVHDGTEPLSWEVRDATGSAVANGTSQVLGLDKASGDHVHAVDFSAVTQPGQGYVLSVDGLTGDPFDIGTELYADIGRDAFKYFYHNRSGTPIDAAYVGDPSWARPAGHPKDEAVCAPNTGCDYKLDVTGGWYDGGDHGKYVVNAGISVWTLLNWYERAANRDKNSPTLADAGKLIPESGNGVPDLLDEVRWELEFLLKMQVPAGQPLAGMAHHKIHDEAWTGLGLAPHEDKMARHLRPPSTAATLNLAAVAAQGARIWKDIDAAFSKRLLDAAKTAYAAAQANPKRIALAADTIGGGPYNDDEISDEFYWAAAELFITTGEKTYRNAFETSKVDGQPKSITGGDTGGAHTAISWQRVDVAAKLSLAVANSKLNNTGQDKYKRQIIGLAEQYAKIVKAEGYGTPLAPSDEGKYVWGSNSLVLNNMVVLASAYDFSNGKRREFLDATTSGMDYLLGRNAMGQSYLTGYGERPLRYPHHRFWSFQANAAYPKAPPGAISGGPNSSIQDPYAKAAGLKGCLPQKCFVDHIEAWSVNEITINWNAPFTWVSYWLDESARTP